MFAVSSKMSYLLTQVTCCFVYRAITGKMAVQFTIKTVNPIEACLYRLSQVFTVKIGVGNGASVCVLGTGSASGTEPNLPVNL